MNCPLSHYFIYTGHNSYLTGNQISSSSSEKPIIEALKRGVRVIELDMWPNSAKDDVHIMHGGYANLSLCISWPLALALDFFYHIVLICIRQDTNEPGEAREVLEGNTRACFRCIGLSGDHNSRGSPHS